MSLFSLSLPDFSTETRIAFPVGLKQRRAGRIVPVFLPFSGCPGRCVYCAQDRQTGRTALPSMEKLMADARAALERLPALSPGEERELAFYGGTFTALPEAGRRTCLRFLAAMREEGRVSHARCSTRPDALSRGVLSELERFGVGLIELGIQSFAAPVLEASRRGYGGEEALAACRIVQDAGFELGIQLLPGLPGCTPDTFLKDVELSLSLRPSCMRFYPCLVPEGTVLARWYREGRYAPWSLEDTVSALGEALRLAWRAGVPVIRLSVAPEPAFDAALLAGPRHPALGALIQAEALIRSAEGAAAELGRPPQSLRLPRACQGFLYGDKGALRERWSALGLGPERISFTDAQQAELRG